MKNKLIFGIFCLSLGAYAANNTYSSAQTRQQEKDIVVGQSIPLDPSGQPRSVLRDRVEASTVDNSKNYKEAQIRKNQRELVLSEIFDTDILMQPVTRIIRPIDTIGITPEYITTILFPANMTVLEAQASFPTTLFDKKNNLMRFRPTRDNFASGNIVLTLTDGTKNYEMTLIVNRYFQKDCHVENNEYICKKMRKSWPRSKDTKSYAYAYNNLSIYYRYIIAKILEPLDAIAEYQKLKHKPLNIPKDDGYDVFVFRGVSYKIIRDDTHGDIYYRAHKYRIVVGG